MTRKVFFALVLVLPILAAVSVLPVFVRGQNEPTKSSPPPEKSSFSSVDIEYWRELYHYLVFKKDGKYYVKDGHSGSIVFVETDCKKANTAIQYALDASNPGEPVFIAGGGNQDEETFWISDTMTLKKPGAVHGFRRHYVRIQPVPGAGVPAIFTMDYADDKCSQFKGIGVYGNEESTHGFHIKDNGRHGGCRFYEVYTPHSHQLGGYAIYNESSNRDIEVWGGVMRGQAGDIYSNDVVEVLGVHRTTGNFDGGSGSLRRISNSDDVADGGIYVDENNDFQVGDVHAYKYVSAVETIDASSDNVSVANISVLFVDANSGDVSIGGFSGGDKGQMLFVVSVSDKNNIIMKDDAGTGNQDIKTNTETDVTVEKEGGVRLVCDGTHWRMLGL